MPTELIAGIDEAGRGALAGPVVAGACILPCPLFRRRHSLPRWSPFRRKSMADCLIADSKQLTPQEREISFAWITAHCLYGVGIADAVIVESSGILAATHLAMQRAVMDLQKRMEEFPSRELSLFLMVDGRDAFTFDLPHRSIIRGDQSEPCIAAASIVAKVTRDRLMRDMHEEFPLYNFARHKGYGTQKHRESIRCFGPCKIHRNSFLSRVVGIL